MKAGNTVRTVIFNAVHELLLASADAVFFFLGGFCGHPKVLLCGS
jgi:hypothetical protein